MVDKKTILPWESLDKSAQVERAEEWLVNMVKRWLEFRAHPERFTKYDVGRLASRIARTQRLLYDLDGVWRTP